jgi:hypothetical protein
MTLRPNLAAGLPFSDDRIEHDKKIMDVIWLIIADNGELGIFFLRLL